MLAEAHAPHYRRTIETCGTLGANDSGREGDRLQPQLPSLRPYFRYLCEAGTMAMGAIAAQRLSPPASEMVDR